MITSLVSYLTEIERLKIPDSGLSSTTLPWFRGQGDSTWKLIPSMYRGDWDVIRERELHRDFILRALMEVDHKPTMYVGWLFVMQHHGLPTRLLDWTESSVAALYFAVENYTNTADAAVWVMHPWKLNEAPLSFGQMSVPRLDDEINKNYHFPGNSWFFDENHEGLAYGDTSRSYDSPNRGATWAVYYSWAYPGRVR